MGGHWSQEAKRMARDSDGGDQFGDSVAIAGQTVLVGAPEQDDPHGPESGAAYVYTRAGGDWKRAAKLVPADGDEDDLFGNAVALSGETALIGASSEEAANGVNAGAAYVFTRSRGTWTQRAKLAADDGNGGDLFGYAVALDDGLVLVGAAFDEAPNGLQAGSAYVFSGSGPSWTQRGKLLAEDGDGGDFFGSSVALSDETVIIGAAADEDPNGFEAGAAYIYRP
ncbi:MAG: FG-GAP repeat protein [Salinirussus sp.]